MARKDTFNTERFGKYLSFELKNTVSRQGLFVLLMGIVPVMLFIVSYLFSLTFSQEKTDGLWLDYVFFRNIVATIASVLFFLIFPIARYGKLTDKREGVMPVLMPVSHTEKFCSAVLISMIIVPAAFILMYAGTDAILSAVFPFSGKPLVEYFCESGIFEDYDGNFSINISFAFFLPPMVSMAGLAGALMFRKNQISKIFFVCAAAFILFLMVMISIIDSLELSPETIRNNFAWFWYTVQSVVTVLLGLYCWIRTERLQL